MHDTFLLKSPISFILFSFRFVSQIFIILLFNQAIFSKVYILAQRRLFAGRSGTVFKGKQLFLGTDIGARNAAIAAPTTD